MSVSPAHAIPPCLNFEHHEEAGRVTVDLRPGPDGRQTTLTIFWFINDVPARPGEYYGNHFVNGKIVGGLHRDDKDDNVHTIFRMSEGWKYGDTYKFQGTHFSPVTNTHYIAAVNECVIVPR